MTSLSPHNMLENEASSQGSISSHEVVSLSQVPQAVTTGSEAPRQSFMRRMSSATSNIFRSDGSRARNQSVTSAVAGLENFGYNDSEFFGAPIPMGADSSDEESQIVKSAASSVEHVPVSMQPDSSPLEEVPSRVEIIMEKMRFWSPEFGSERKRIFRTLLLNYIYLVLGFAACLCIYWGSFYDRLAHLRNISYLVVNGDAPVGDLPPLIGFVATEFFLAPLLDTYGKFEVWDYTTANSKAQSANMTLDQLVKQQVNIQKYAAGYLVRENATAVMYQMLATANATFSPVELLTVYYETGSDYNLISNTVVPFTQSIVNQFGQSMRSVRWSQFWFRILNQTQVSTVMSNAPLLLTTLPNFQLVDLLPVKQAVFQAPLQIGLIYLCVFTFFQFVFTFPVQIEIAKKVQGMRYVLFRMALAQGAYFFLSLAYITLNTAFQMNFRATFGNLGFLVIWMFAFLTMSSVGSIIEILTLIAFVFNPACVGLVILFVAVVNLAPTISAIPLCPKVYRYGYAMPVYNSYHLMNIAYFNSWKGNIGRYIGILVAWIVVSNAMMPFVMKYAFGVMKKRKQAAIGKAAGGSG